MGGILGNWTVHFNFSALRMISFSMDYYWSLQNKKVNTEDEEDEQRRRIATSCQSADYNFINYLCFLLYCPLFLAGPIITFNDFISQVSNSCLNCVIISMDLDVFANKAD